MNPLKNASIIATFHVRLRMSRDTSGLSQSELAARVGVRPPVISHFENKRRFPSMSTLRKLADSLGVSADYLLGRSPEPSGSSTEPIGDTTIARVHQTLENLTEKDREDVLNYAQFKASQRKPTRHERAHHEHPPHHPPEMPEMR